MKPTRQTEDRGSGVNSVEIGLSLLEPLLEAGTSLPLKAIAEASGLAPPKAHRYLASLSNVGLLEREPNSARYRLGPLAYRLGFAALGMLDREALGRTAIADLSAATQVTACLVVWADTGPMVIAVEPGPGTIFTGIRVGSHLPLLRSATGRLFLAHLPPSHTRNQLLAEGDVSSNWIEAHGAQLAEIRASGVSRIKDSVMTGMSGLAAPVFDHSATVSCAVTLVFQTALVDDKRAHALAEDLKAATADFSRRLGFVRRIPDAP
ncbi:IclR family transcriptional regulator [Bradyrhizobium sp. ma5]|uniref:IclR family transcriptional regulator n=1 Tax=Bradyrhizobium sp. ma5 TaxID=3344828 RepID=UPI0035D4F710